MKYRLKQTYCMVYCGHGFDASYMTGGHSGWKALGGEMELQP